MISVCQWWSCRYKDFFFSRLSCGGMLSYGHSIGSVKLHVLACKPSRGLNVDHWLVAVMVFAVTLLW